MSTLLQIVNQVKNEVGVEGAALASVTGLRGMPQKLITWVQEAEYSVQALHFDWDFLWSQYSETTTAGTAAHAAPSDLGVWDRESFWLDYTTNDASRLNVVEYRKYRDTLRAGVKTNSPPDAVVILPSKSLVLDPPPDGVYTLTADYWKAPVKMAAAGDTPLIPAQYERVIIARAKMYFAEEEEFPGLYKLAAAEFATMLPRLEANQLPEQERRYLAEAPALAVTVG